MRLPCAASWEGYLIAFRGQIAETYPRASTQSPGADAYVKSKKWCFRPYLFSTFRFTQSFVVGFIARCSNESSVYDGPSMCGASVMRVEGVNCRGWRVWVFDLYRGVKPFTPRCDPRTHLCLSSMLLMKWGFFAPSLLKRGPELPRNHVRHRYMRHGAENSLPFPFIGEGCMIRARYKNSYF